jgi:hypothetical protein
VSAGHTGDTKPVEKSSASSEEVKIPLLGPAPVPGIFSASLPTSELVKSNLASSRRSSSSAYATTCARRSLGSAVS